MASTTHGPKGPLWGERYFTEGSLAFTQGQPGLQVTVTTDAAVVPARAEYLTAARLLHGE